MSSQERYESELHEFLEIYARELNIDNQYISKAFSIYTDILSRVDSFESFQNRLNPKAKGIKCISAALLYVALLSNGIDMQINTMAIYKHPTTIGKAFHSIIRMVDGMKEYCFLLSDSYFKGVSDEFYLMAIQEQIKDFATMLVKNDWINEEEIPLILDNFNNHAKKEGYIDYFKNRSTKYASSAYLYVYLYYFKNIKVSMKDFSRLIQLEGNEKFCSKNYTNLEIPVSLRKNVNAFVSKFFNFDLEKYKVNVKTHLRHHVNVLKKYFEKKDDLDESMKIADLFSNEFIDTCVEIFDKVIESGFEVFYTSKGRHYYHFPQMMGLTILYFTSKSDALLRKIITQDLFQVLKNRGLILSNCDYSTRAITRSDSKLARRIRSQRSVERYKWQRYSREEFAQVMRDALKKHYHLETEFLLRLYSQSDLDPNEFGDEMMLHGMKGIGGVFQTVNRVTKFTEPQTFNKIKSFICSCVNSTEYFFRSPLLHVNNFEIFEILL